MGRTIPSWRIIVEQEARSWKSFRGSLRTEDKTVFDEMIDECRRYASSAGAACFPSKWEGMFLNPLRTS